MTHLTFDKSKVSTNTKEEILDTINWVKLNFSRKDSKINNVINSLFGLFDGYYYDNLTHDNLNAIDGKLTDEIMPLVLKINNEVGSFSFSLNDQKTVSADESTANFI